MDDVKHIVYWLTGFVGALITLFSGEWEFSVVILLLMYVIESILKYGKDDESE